MTPPTDDASARQGSGGPSPGLGRRGYANNGSRGADSAGVDRQIAELGDRSTMFVGIESPNEAALRETKKFQNLRTRGGTMKVTLIGRGGSAPVGRSCGTDAFHRASVLLHGQPQPLDLRCPALHPCDLQPRCGQTPWPSCSATWRG
jgi:hypothetical protein